MNFPWLTTLLVLPLVGALVVALLPRASTAVRPVALGFSLLFGGVVLARMRALLAEVQTEARLRRKALES